jgi:hypothetical protein
MGNCRFPHTARSASKNGVVGRFRYNPYLPDKTKTITERLYVN